MSARRPVIELEGVSKAYRDGGEGAVPYAVKDVTFSVLPGEFVILFGPSGSGKSTLLNLMAGLEMPTKGKVKSHGYDLSHYGGKQLARFHRRRMGMVFQNFNLIRSLTVLENVVLPMMADDKGIRYRTRKAMALLEKLGVSGYAKLFPSEVSGGEQQRIAIARALVTDPDLLLVDEPTGNLDTAAADVVMEILAKLNREDGHTIVLVTHNPEYLRYATRVIRVKDGETYEDLG